MFPINFNFPYRKKDGSLITMEKALDGAGADLDLIDLDDVAITNPADGDGLIYDNTAKKWKNIPIISRKVGTVTAESGYSFVTGYDNKAYRSINTVFVNLKVTQFTPSSTAWINIATLPEGFRPTSQIVFPVMDDNRGIAVSGRIDNNGKVYVWGTANTAILPFVNTTYIVS